MILFTAQALVLIVDDNSRNIQLVANIVKENGFKVAIAQNGREALDFLQTKRPDLILLDIMMPEMDGLEACRRIKADERYKNIPVIFITALSDTQNILKAFEVGGNDYITKPFIREEVQARIKVHIKLKKAIEELAGLAITDELTGVFNRRYALKILTREISLSSRKKKKFVLCYIDIDNLKIINDTYGHNAGDRLITTVVQGVQEVIRASDYLFRMGGDEFMLIFPDAELTALDNLVNRLQKTLNRKEINSIPIDFSYGFAEFDPQEPIGCKELIKKADTCMYAQKKTKKKLVK
ncbi:MAG: diguanylate cyclase [Candidatus Electrothrix sp. AR3]|nr:diguanylate cyclase [Candidatus Electrothrix sp. AR3]